MKPLPSAIEQFVKSQNTIAIAELREANAEAEDSPYGSYWYRAVAAMLRSGRVAAKANGAPNRTDINRMCKEANFNQHLFERIANFFIAAKVVQTDRRGQYVDGIHAASFWNHRREELTEMMHDAILQLIQDNTGVVVWRPTMAIHSSLIEFLILFFTSFHGRALREDQIGKMMLEFCRLPEPDLRKFAANAGQKTADVSGWKHWLDEKGQQALLSALYTTEWAYYAERQKIGWVMPSPIGLGLLGIGPLPEAPVLAKDFKADSNLAIYAGAGLDFDVLVPLFRFCKIKRIGQIIEFQVDPKRLKELPSAATDLRAILADLDPLPSVLVAALQTKSPLGGKIGIRFCSALIKPETANALDAIRQHPQLKGYLEPGAPPGFLLIKQGSNPSNFVQRCRVLGFEIKPL